MRRILGCLLIFGLITVPALLGTDYYVDGSSGNDNNSGISLGAAWKTLTKANSTLTAGDTVYIRGGIYSTNDGNAIINPDNSGSSGNYITYTSYNGEEVILRNTSASGPSRGIVLNQNYIKIDGITINNISQSQSEMDHFVIIGNDKHHNIIQNCTMQYLSDHWDSFSNGIYIGTGNSYHQILYNTVEYVGTAYNHNECNGIMMQDHGASHHNLIQGNVVNYAGHSPIQGRGHHNIIKDNIVYNPWWRCLEQLCDSDDTSQQYNVWDGNIGYGTAAYNSWRPPLFQCMGQGIIIRRNRVYSGVGEGYRIYSKIGRLTKNVKIYNNVAYDCGQDGQAGTDTGITINESVLDTMDNCDFRNNIFYNNHTDSVRYLQYANASEHTNTNNHWNASGNPQFVNESNNNFQLQSNSPCIDMGTFLTQTRSSGSGTQIPVADAGFFCDGFGIIQGDTIQLEGQTPTARITSINYSTNTITVNASLSWYSGQGVSLAYSGASPDMGAFEYQGSSPDPLIANANGSPGTGYIPLTVNFTGSASGGAPPYSYSWTFGDGGTSTSQNPSHTYTTVGDFTATLTVTDNASNHDSDSIIIHTSSLGQNFTLSISSSTGSPAPGSGGTVSPSPGDHDYSAGTNLQLSATPNSNYRFSRWTGDIDDALIGNSQFTLTMDADKSIAAKFCTRCGDVNGDLTITPIDAQYIFEIFLGILSDPTLCQRENADVNDDGTRDNPNVTPFDAQSIFDFYLGKSGLPGDCSCNSRSSTSGSLMTMTSRKENIDFNILVQDPLTLPGGDEILVPVMIDSSIRLESFGFDLAFDSDYYEFAGVVRAELTADFLQVDGNVIEEGVLRVGGYRETTSEDCTPGELVILIFRIKEEPVEPISFPIIKTYDDLKNASIDTERETLVR